MRKLLEKRKIDKHIIVGDFNFSDTAWPDGRSTNSIERLFLDTFNDLGLQQILETPTHQQG